MTTAACADFGGFSRGGGAPVDPAHWIVVQLEDRGHCSIQNDNRPLIAAIPRALDLWRLRPARAHEAVFEIYDMVGGATELRAVEVPATESGYQDAAPFPHAHLRAERRP